MGNAVRKITNAVGDIGSQVFDSLADDGKVEWSEWLLIMQSAIMRGISVSKMKMEEGELSNLSAEDLDRALGDLKDSFHGDTQAHEYARELLHGIQNVIVGVVQARKGVADLSEYFKQLHANDKTEEEKAADALKPEEDQVHPG